MQIQANTVEEYINAVPEDRKEAIIKLRRVILDNIPVGFAEVMQYSMPAYVVPHTIYPAGYHCTPEEPLPFISFASQKSFIALYHKGIYADDKLLEWFRTEYPKHSPRKLDMGKSCIRFKNIKHIPFELIGELVSKMKAAEFISIYERAIKR